jgi:hypothetical protein
MPTKAWSQPSLSGAIMVTRTVAAHHLLEPPEAQLRLAGTLQKPFTVEMVQHVLAAW